jgi:hypothetical protein
MAKRKTIRKSKNIRANSITLVDSEGRARITLDAGGKDGHASICLFARDGKSVQISSQPEGAIAIHVFGRSCTSNICIGLSGDERGGIWISDASGRLGTILGEEPGTSTHRLLLFKDGQHFWQTPSGKKKSRTMRSSQRRPANAARRGSP